MNRQKKEQARQLLVEYLEELKAEIESTKRMIESLSDNSSLSDSDRPLKPVEAKDSLFAELTPQQIVFNFLKSHPDKAYRAREASNELIKQKVNGHERDSFHAVVASTLNRLVVQQKAIKTERQVANRENKVAFYQLNSDFIKKGNTDVET